MALKNGDKFTIYDAMEVSGYFSTNPANAGARDKDGRPLYKGPQKFPMMVYHPRGEEFVSSPGTMEKTSWGTVEKFGEQWEIINRVVNTEEELDAALAEGWHKHPAFAIKVANETWRKEHGLKPFPVPPISATSHIAELEERTSRWPPRLLSVKRRWGGFPAKDALEDGRRERGEGGWGYTNS